MSVRTRVDAPQRTQRSAPRRAHSADRVKSGAAQRAYARRRNRAGERVLPPLPRRAGSIMAGRLPFVAAILALLGCGLLATLVLTTHAAEDSYQLSDARRINRQLFDERAALQREVEAADSAPELANRARELGMIPAKDPARLLVAPDGSVTVVGKETPAEGAPVPPLNTTPAKPGALPPKLAQAQGERLVPVTTTPAPPAPAPGPADQNQPPAPTTNAPQPPAQPTQVPAPVQAAPAAPAAPPAGTQPAAQAAPAAPAAEPEPAAQAAPVAPAGIQPTAPAGPPAPVAPAAQPAGAQPVVQAAPEGADR
ncbi:hypothetical protein [Nocardia nova]|uniref:hypothetical protein n=1 Tax=Nocardia nova TaxID=37330 RepID=UPI001E2F83C1|nr:hypothetical protein [Nocardia nova]